MGTTSRIARSRSRGGALPALAVTVCALAAVAGLAACGDGGGGDSDGPDLTRVAWARMYLEGVDTLPKETPESIGKALAELEPTYVTGLVRLEAQQAASKSSIADYDKIRDIVREKVPDAEFDVELNALEFKSADEVTDQMSTLRGQFDPDGWFFDFFTPAYQKSPEVVDAAIAEAHDHGEWIGGNTFGWNQDPSNPVVPKDTNFLALADAEFKLNLDGVKTLAESVPILFHLRNNPDFPQSEGCIYMNRWTTSKREKYIALRASEQAQYDFHFAYPVFFPSCQVSPKAPLRDVVSYDSIRDRGMLDTIKKLMEKHNSS